jgi:hypothetical protein
MSADRTCISSKKGRTPKERCYYKSSNTLCSKRTVHVGTFDVICSIITRPCPEHLHILYVTLDTEYFVRYCQILSSRFVRFCKICKFVYSIRRCQMLLDHYHILSDLENCHYKLALHCTFLKYLFCFKCYILRLFETVVVILA